MGNGDSFDWRFEAEKIEIISFLNKLRKSACQAAKLSALHGRTVIYCLKVKSGECQAFRTKSAFSG
jgi:hypothetical protein